VTSSKNYIKTIEDFANFRVLCIGDVILDTFNHGNVLRISPERPVPVFRPGKLVHIPGGAANVAYNIVALGGYCTLIGVVGNDDPGVLLKTLLEHPKLSPRLLVSEDYTTTHKTRLTASSQHLVRLDTEHPGPIADDISFTIIGIAEQLIATHQVLVLSDYAKGIFAQSLLSSLISIAKSSNIPVIVDPKGVDLFRYSGATLLTPNSSEVEALTGISVENDSDAEVAGAKLLSLGGINSALITRGSAGMTLCSTGQPTKHIPSCALDVFDVVGAGDTVVAGLACALATGSTTADAATLANAAAGIVVGKRDTAIVTKAELINRLEIIGKPVNRQSHFCSPCLNDDNVTEWLNKHRDNGQRIGFTNGVFDIVHPGHISLLLFSRQYCDILLIGINSDSSVKNLDKAPNRPINTVSDRVCVLSAFSMVDATIIFNEETPLRLIQLIKPDVLVKGSDYSLNNVVGADYVSSYGGKVLLAPIEEGKSSSLIISRFK
jgi:D-beta-D-heptose 7-phosphate kinase / D-beta-D-heptose 1-phosphate adenosyltransferase